MNEFEKKLQEAIAARDTFINCVNEMEAIMDKAECKTLTGCGQLRKKAWGWAFYGVWAMGFAEGFQV